MPNCQHLCNECFNLIQLMDLISKKLYSQLLLHWHLRDLDSDRVHSLQLSGSGLIGPVSDDRATFVVD